MLLAQPSPLFHADQPFLLTRSELTEPGSKRPRTASRPNPRGVNFQPAKGGQYSAGDDNPRLRDPDDARAARDGPWRGCCEALDDIDWRGGEIVCAARATASSGCRLPLSRPPRSVVTPTTSTRAMPPPGAIGRRSALPAPGRGEATPGGFPRSLPFARRDRCPAVPLRAWRSDHAGTRHTPGRRPSPPEAGPPAKRVPAHRLPGLYRWVLSRWSSLEGVRSLVHSHYTLSASLAAPARSDSPRTSRRCQDCSPPFPAAPGSGCPQLHRGWLGGCPRTTRGGSSTPHEPTAPRGALSRPATCMGARPPAAGCGTLRPGHPALGTAPRRVLGQPVNRELLDKPVDFPGRDPVHVGLHHHRHNRLLAPPPRLRETRKVRATRALAWGSAARSRPPASPTPRPAPVAMRVGASLLCQRSLARAGSCRGRR